jgi:REP element-mobilizing transposase RayT
MPNHVHLLVTPWTDVPMLLRRLKGVTAREANQVLARRGPFWQHESYDRLVRDEREFCRIENYIVQNPVKAGLAAAPELYLRIPTKEMGDSEVVPIRIGARRSWAVP